MHDVLDIINNIEGIYESDTAFQVLKDFERVLDELDIYVYKNWETGELAEGPKIERHWVTCTFMWPKEEMPDPMGGKRLLDYDCKVKYIKSSLMTPRKIMKPDDMRPGTKKGKIDLAPIWLVQIQMPKKLIADIYSGYIEELMQEPAQEVSVTSQTEEPDDLAMDEPELGAGEEPGGEDLL